MWTVNGECSDVTGSHSLLLKFTKVRDRCYDFKIFSPKNLAKKWAIFASNYILLVFAIIFRYSFYFTFEMCEKC
jgi:hypothetical protein